MFGCNWHSGYREDVIRECHIQCITFYYFFNWITTKKWFPSTQGCFMPRSVKIGSDCFKKLEYKQLSAFAMLRNNMYQSWIFKLST